MAEIAVQPAGAAPAQTQRPVPPPTPSPSTGGGGGEQTSTSAQPRPSPAPAGGSPAPATGQSGQPAAPAPVPTQGSSAQPVTVVADQTTLDVRSLPAPATLAARVVSTEVLGQASLVRLDTALGRVAVSTTPQAPALEPGAQLKLLIEPGGAVRLQYQPAQPTPATGQATTAVGGGPAGQLAAGDIVKAQLLPAGSPTATPFGKSAGAAVVVRIVSIQAGGGQPAAAAGAGNSAPPANAAAPSPASAAPTVSLPATPALQAALSPVTATGAGTQAGALQLLTGSTGTAAATTTLVAAATQHAAVPLTATVSGHAPLGQPVLTGSGATLLLANGNLPDGATVRLEVLATQGAAPRTAAVISGLTGVLDEAMAVLAATQPAMAAAVDAGRVPRFGPKLASSALFLLSALQGGGVPSMLGRDAQQALRQSGHDNLLRRIGEALAQRAPRIEGDPATGDTWRSVYVPVAADQGWQPLRVAWRDGGAEAEGNEDEAGSRFQVDFSFSRIGPTRLDGLVGSGRLDLLLVTRSGLPQGVRAEVGDLFAETIEIMGLKGHLRFVAKPDLAPPEQQAAPEHAAVTA